jgi:hypothetical protein
MAYITVDGEPICQQFQIQVLRETGRFVGCSGRRGNLAFLKEHYPDRTFVQRRGTCPEYLAEKQRIRNIV